MDISSQLTITRAVSLPICSEGPVLSPANEPETSANQGNGGPLDQIKVSSLPRTGLPAVAESFWQAPLKNSAKSLAGAVNAPIYQYLRSLYHSPLHQPLIQALENNVSPAKTGNIKALELTALGLARQQLPQSSASERVLLAYQALAAVAAYHNFRDPDFFQGQSDKALHYFSSALLTAASAAKLPSLPGQAKLAGIFSDSIGVLKEIVGPPYNHEDLRANREGIAAAKLALRRDVQQFWWLDRTGFAQ